jgi:hypothetical protein
VSGSLRQQLFFLNYSRNPEKIETRYTSVTRRFSYISASDGSIIPMTTYYEILGLPGALRHEPHLPAQTLRSAYRRALLQNHPDRAASMTKTEVYSIDQISEAFSILSNPKSRAVYDKDLKLRSSAINANGITTQTFRTGIETVDLDDLETNGDQGIWYRSCRCGEERGFLIKEDDLEEAAEDGEVSVGCKGCSLWLKVLFGIMEDTQEESRQDSRDHKAR